eukprot:TRINITY_DN20823_c0_g1_i1.p1 TRINITY_DN20823_c0_g1~~TRINITY_DN20823_c0_g1_i1.p1  ORF type:complete len:279 (+),score=16.33 TRINITY_DN20823_c0_g1_i1:47-883(+)
MIFEVLILMQFLWSMFTMLQIGSSHQDITILSEDLNNTFAETFFENENLNYYKRQIVPDVTLVRHYISERCFNATASVKFCLLLVAPPSCIPLRGSTKSSFKLLVEYVVGQQEDECKSNPCDPGLTCIDSNWGTPGSYRCFCPGDDIGCAIRENLGILICSLDVFASSIDTTFSEFSFWPLVSFMFWFCFDALWMYLATLPLEFMVAVAVVCYFNSAYRDFQRLVTHVPDGIADNWVLNSLRIIILLPILVVMYLLYIPFLLLRLLFQSIPSESQIQD